MDIFINIYNSIVDTIFNILTSIVELFPDMPEAIALLPEDMSDYISWVGNVINVDALTTVVGIFIAYEVIMITVRLSLFIWRLTPWS